MYRLYLYFIELNMTTSFKYFETNMKQIKTILSPNRNKIDDIVLNSSECFSYDLNIKIISKIIK